ncbi:MFS transporter [Rhizobium sp. GN54]|uniref:MFS transporter n=1 Tax=Rhizobium sp. GN54 TaxID=2898150 RepID=UPI003FA6C51E
MHALDELSRKRRRLWPGTEVRSIRRRSSNGESRAVHRRRHGRVSNADADLQQKVITYHAGPGRPVVRHVLTINRQGRA